MTFKVGVEEGILGNYSVLVEELESQPNLGCSTAKKHVPRRTQLTYTFAQLCQSMLCSLCYHGGFNSECRTEIPVPKARSCFRISHEESSKSCSTTKVTHQTTPPGSPQALSITGLNGLIITTEEIGSCPDTSKRKPNTA